MASVHLNDGGGASVTEAKSDDSSEEDEILTNPDKFRDPNLTTLGQVGDAIERAKQAVVDFDGQVEGKNVLVQRLVQLRIQEYVMMERAAGPIPDFETRGHSFTSWSEGKGNFPRIVNPKKIFCEV